MYMQRALALALNGSGFVNPNPRVGCVIVRDNEIIGEGFHGQFGGPHAEIEALNSVGGSAEGATLYVNLEPCSVQGKTPPCTDAIIEAGIAKVVCSHVDPNPKVNGTGIQQLREAGIAVEVGVLEGEARWLNRAFITAVSQQRTYVLTKVAQSLDGSIATKYGQSQWITCEESRVAVHRMRAEVDAVLIGATTAQKDDPLLTVRDVEGRNPKRIVLDESLGLPLQLNMFVQPDRENTIVFCSHEMANSLKANALKVSGVHIVGAELDENEQLSIPDVLKQLYEMNIHSVLVEGGSEIFSSFLRGDHVDELRLFIAPTIIGDGMRSFSSLSTNSLQQSKKYEYKMISQSGVDIQAVLTRRMTDI